jgi:hypothetical protein
MTDPCEVAKLHAFQLSLGGTAPGLPYSCSSDGYRFENRFWLCPACDLKAAKMDNSNMAVALKAFAAGHACLQKAIKGVSNDGSES